ncbi:uncharacterized protein LOC117642894 [Thrips palmi]|uniref:Uncharacterized protein LOC117642894 n=1 Tax=Thrips palmi TaxID=161013 RepID=A0A6P8ZKN4_THRPL|nr:uncharacterized protein LOC117642894 [Thrips palmi]
MASPMAQPGMPDRWGGRERDPSGRDPAAREPVGPQKGATEGSDEVQRSLELLDSVLSEFDDLENGNLAAGTTPGPPTGTTVLPASAAAPLHPTRSIRSMAGSGSGSGSGEGEGDLLISSSTPEDDSSPSLSLSLGGHQSEDDGYMSMNGRRNKLALNFRPHNGTAGTAGLVAIRRGSADMLTAPEKPLPPPPGMDVADFPPPPEEAQRLIANLLPRVSPSNSVQRGFVGLSGSRGSSSIVPARQRHVASLPQTRRHIVLSPTEPRVTTATQTTLPGTRNQRPFGWEVDAQPPTGILPPPNRFASLQNNGQQGPRVQQHSWLPPRPLPASQLKRTSTGEEEHFSDDSLEDMPPPPPPPEVAEQVEAVSKRGSIAWEVPLDQDPQDPYEDPAVLTPGSTKVVGRRRRRQSTEHYSSSSSLQQDDWPDPPSREHEPTSPSSSCFGPDEDLYESNFLPSSLSASDLSNNGTYVIRKGRKKERKPVRNPLDSLQYNKAKMQLRYADVKRCTYTFDDLDTASDAGGADVADGIVQVVEQAEASQYPMVRVLSLPSLCHAEEARQQVEDQGNRRLTLEQQEKIDKMEKMKQQEERLIQRLQGLQGLAATPEEDEPSSSLVFNDDHNDDSLEPISNLALDEDPFRDSNAPLSLIEEQAENGTELDDAQRHNNAGQIGGRLTSRELDEIAEIQYRKQLPPPPPVLASGDRYTAPHADYYNLNKDRIAENCRIAESREAATPTKDMYRPRKSASSNDVFSDTKCFPDNSHSLSSTREREERPASRRSSNDRRRHHQNMAAEMSSMERWRTTHEMNHVQVVPVVEKAASCHGHSRNGSASSLNRNTAEKDKKTHTVTVEVNQHDFGPLPPSPVDEFEEDEYSEILHPSPGQAARGKADTLPEPFYQCREPLGSDPSGARYLNRPPEPPPHSQPRDPLHSLKTRSMDAGFTRGFRNASQSSALRRESPSSSERRTLPNDLPGPSHVRRRAFQKRSSSSPQESGLQTSCSLPETPIFARGCDIPRTPHRRAPDVPSGSSGSMRAAASSGTSSSAAGTATRPGGLHSVVHTSSYRKMGPGGLGLGLGTGVSLDSGGLGQALVGAELLRLTGGPGRGWYPRHRTPRPASIEHLDRVATQRSPGPWDARDARKPMTLPPNMTPKFFHRSPRDALRRVTSLLIRGKGGSSKESKKDTLSPSGGGFGFGPHIWHREDARADCLDQDVGESSRQKRGFFKGLWKRSRGYSLDHQ